MGSFYGEDTWPYEIYQCGNSLPPEKIAFENSAVFFAEWARPCSGGVDSDILKYLKGTK